MSKVSSKQVMQMAAIFAVLIAAIIFMSGREEEKEEFRGMSKKARRAMRRAMRRARKMR